MPFIEWSERISVGHPLIDSDHHKLIDLVNRLHDAMTHRRGAAVLGEVLRELIDYTRVHFAHEERLMREHSYPKLHEHRRQHADLVGRVLDLERKFTAGVVLLSVEVMEFLKQWLTVHIMEHDKALAVFLVKASPAA